MLAHLTFRRNWICVRVWFTLSSRWYAQSWEDAYKAKPQEGRDTVSKYLLNQLNLEISPLYLFKMVRHYYPVHFLPFSNTSWFLPGVLGLKHLTGRLSQFNWELVVLLSVGDVMLCVHLYISSCQSNLRTPLMLSNESDLIMFF